MLITTIAAILILPPTAFLQTAGLTSIDIRRIEGPFTRVANAFAVAQPPWTIFAPLNQAEDRYYVFAAEDLDGQEHDLFAGRPLSFQRPNEELHRQYGHYRDRFFLENLRHLDDERMTRDLGEYLCRTYETANGAALRSIDFYFVAEQVTQETVDAPAERERDSELFQQHTCAGQEPADITTPRF